MTYYGDQLDRLTDSEFYKTIIVGDGTGQKTNTLDLNRESIPVLIEFLKREQKRLRREGAKQCQE